MRASPCGGDAAMTHSNGGSQASTVQVAVNLGGPARMVSVIGSPAVSGRGAANTETVAGCQCDHSDALVTNSNTAAAGRPISTNDSIVARRVVSSGGSCSTGAGAVIGAAGRACGGREPAAENNCGRLSGAAGDRVGGGAASREPGSGRPRGTALLRPAASGRFTFLVIAGPLRSTRVAQIQTLDDNWYGLCGHQGLRDDRCDSL